MLRENFGNEDNDNPEYDKKKTESFKICRSSGKFNSFKHKDKFSIETSQ